MSYCLNPECKKPQNPAGTTNFCTSCGSKLLFRNRYHDIELIGEGVFGKTFLAKDAERIDAPCVIKQFLPVSQIRGNSASMKKATQLFEQEAKRLLQLGEQHPQIPTLFAYFEEDGCLYLVQQYIEGQNLWQELQQEGAFSEQQIRRLLNDLLPVLQFVHEHRVIHRDIKPTNIVRRSPRSVTKRGERDGAKAGKLVLIDFGISKQLRYGTRLTVTGTKAGTEGYAAIEQLRGGKAYPASDLYSLGVTCIHLLTAAELDNLFDPLHGKWLWREYLSKRGTAVSPTLCDILDKLLKEYVNERYQSAAEVLKDLNGGAIAHTADEEAQARIAGKMVVLQAAAPKARNQTWRCVHTLTGHSGYITSVAISMDGETVASSSDDKTINLWHVGSGKLIRTLTGHSKYVESVAFSQDAVVSGSGDNTIKIWNSNTGKPIHTLKGHSRQVLSVAIGSHCNIIASGSDDKTVNLWRLDSGQLICTLTDHSSWVLSVAFSPFDVTGKMPVLLASGSRDKTINLWHVETSKLIRTLTGHSYAVNAVAFSCDGQILASGSGDNTIKIWHAETGKLLRTITGHSYAVNAVAFSPNTPTGALPLLASGSEDNTIKIWQTDTCKLIHTLTGHSSYVRSVAFSPDGQILASGSGDKTIKIWRCD